MLVAEGRSLQVRIPVRWDDVDPAGVIFFGSCFRFFQAAEEELFRSAGKGLHQVLSELKIWVPRVEAHADFTHPARFGDLLEVTIRVAALGNSSIRYKFEMLRADPQPAVAVANGHVVIVCVSQETFRPLPIPAALRELLSAAV
jgi:4-hydroxybenzoyl-CoA thioesterase